ncbi:MAG: hypothetical protein ACRC50_08715 [Gaiella sp.]
MRCDECGCHSETGAGWIALLAEDPDDDEAPAAVVLVCPPCAARELDYVPRVAYT